MLRKIYLSNPKVRNGFFTVLFYSIYILIALFLEFINSSAHAPSIGYLMLLILPFVAGLLLVINIIQLFLKLDRTFNIFIHLIILGACIAIYTINFARQ